MATSDPQDRAEQLDDDKVGSEFPAELIDTSPDERLDERVRRDLPEE